MKALVLTYDGREPFVELVVKSYNKLWPGHGFEFIVPYNNEEQERFKKYPNVKMIKALQSPYNTIKTLLENIPDDEMIYWCLDDIYIHKILKPELLTSFKKHVSDIKDSGAFRLTNHDTLNGRIRGNDTFMIEGHKFYNTRFSPYGFWFHQFMSAKILKDCFLKNPFLGAPLNQDYTMEELGYHRDGAPHIYSHKVYVPHDYIAIFGETTRYGNAITENCLKAFDEYEIEYGDKIKSMRVMPSVFNNRKLHVLDKKILSKL